MSLMNIAEQKPYFGANYDVGYIGFTVTKASFVSAGISWFTKWDRPKSCQSAKMVNS